MMKKRNSILGLFLALIMVIAVSCGKKAEVKGLNDASNEVKTIALNEVIKVTQDKAQKDKILVIDGRAKADYEAGHVLNSVNVEKSNMANMVADLADYKEKPVVIYGSDDNLSKEAGKVLLDNGFKNVSVATGLKDVKDYEFQKFSNITGQTFEKKLGEKANMFVLDIRPEKDLANGFIDGSKHIPLDNLKDRLSEVPKDKEIVVYCNTGTKSVEGAKILKEAGYNVLNVIDGTKEFNYKELKKN